MALKTADDGHETSEQPKELRPLRQTKGIDDVDCFMQWLTSYSPFEFRPANMLASLSIGVITDDSVNCDKALRVTIGSWEGMIC